MCRLPSVLSTTLFLENHLLVTKPHTSKTKMKPKSSSLIPASRTASFAFILFAMSAPQAFAQTWNGATSGNWDDATNWDGGTAPTTGTAIVFTGSANPLTNNNISSLTTGAITFNTATAASFTLAGNGIVLGGNLTTGALTAGTVQTHLINFDMQLNGDRLFNAANFNNLTLNGAITEDATPRNVSRGTATGTINWNGANTFSGTLTLNGSGANVFNSIADTGSSAIGIGTANIILSAAGTQFTFNGAAPGATARNITIGTAGAVGAAATITNNSTDAANSLTLSGTVTNGSANKVFVLAGSNTGANLASGVISNPAAGILSFSKNGTGTWALSGANTFTGTLAINQGLLSVSNIGSVGSASSSLGAQTTVANATINMGNGANLSTLLYTGSGETTDRIINFAGTNQTATINHSGTGVLRFTSGTTATVDGNKVFSLNGTGIASGKRGEFAGVIGNPATGVTTLTKADSGRWALQATNTFTGPVNCNNGFLEVSSIGNQGVASNLGAGTTIGFGQGTANGTLEYVGSGETTNRIVDLKTGSTGGGRIDNNGTGALIFTGNTLHSGINNDKTLTLGGSSTGFVNQFDGIINDQAAFKVGLAKIGPSIWSLGGANTYTGTTAVSAGTLLVNGSTSTGAVTVASSATLGGNGTLGGTVTLDTSGNLSPGAAANTAAILTLSTDLDVSSAAPYTGLILMDLDAPAGTNDRINVGGQAIIGTGELGLNNFTFNNLGGLAAGSYTLISANGGISGTLDATNLTDTIAPGLSGTLAISGNNITLTVAAAGNPYDTWITTFGLTGPNAAFDFDFDKDGFANGLEWILGGTPSANDSGTLVTATGSAATGVTLSFDREEDSIGVASLSVEYGTTLATWPGSATIGATSSGPDGNGVVVTVNAVPNPDEVTINIPASNSAGGKLFARLKAVLLP